MLEKYFSLLAALMMKGDNFFKGKARSRNRWSMVQYRYSAAMLGVIKSVQFRPV